MNCNCSVIHVEVQSPAQHLHVFFQVVPQEAENIAGSRVDHVSNFLCGQSRTGGLVSWSRRLWQRCVKSTQAHPQVSAGALKHGEVRQQPQDAGLSRRQLSLGSFRPPMSLPKNVSRPGLVSKPRNQSDSCLTKTLPAGLETIEPLEVLLKEASNRGVSLSSNRKPTFKAFGSLHWFTALTNKVRMNKTFSELFLSYFEQEKAYLSNKAHMSVGTS